MTSTDPAEKRADRFVRELAELKVPDPAAGRLFDGGWFEWLHCQILIREAEGSLKSDRTHLSQTQHKQGKVPQ